MTAIFRPARLTIAPLCLLALAACGDIVIPGMTPPEPEAPPERVLPAAVRAALLPGVPESIVIEDGRGCYLVSNVITEPRQGYLVTDATGEPLCYDELGNRVPRVAVTGPVMETVADPAAEEAEPALPPA